MSGTAFLISSSTGASSSGIRRMAKMNKYIRRFWKETRAQDLVEYALAAGMVAVAAVAAMPQLSTTVNNVFSKIASIVTAALGS
jgi:pilus assembly protein Flp/PilA